MRRAPAALAALAAVAVLAAGCASGGEGPGGGDVDVNTPKLQELKADAGIEACEPGDGSGGDLPDVTLPCLGGGDDVDLASLTGPLVINMWWSGCPPCRDEMPALQQFHERYGDQVEVLGIDSQDNYPEAAIALAEETGATYPQLADPLGELGSTDIAPVGYPHFVFVDADGEVVGQRAGGVDSLADVVALVEKNLDVRLTGTAR